MPTQRFVRAPIEAQLGAGMEKRKARSRGGRRRRLGCCGTRWIRRESDGGIDFVRPQPGREDRPGEAISRDIANVKGSLPPSRRQTKTARCATALDSVCRRMYHLPMITGFELFGQ
jgi:hypothetical protein